MNLDKLSLQQLQDFLPVERNTSQKWLFLSFLNILGHFKKVLFSAPVFSTFRTEFVRTSTRADEFAAQHTVHWANVCYLKKKNSAVKSGEIRTQEVNKRTLEPVLLSHKYKHIDEFIFKWIKRIKSLGRFTTFVTTAVFLLVLYGLNPLDTSSRC